MVILIVHLDFVGTYATQVTQERKQHLVMRTALRVSPGVDDHGFHQLDGDLGTGLDLFPDGAARFLDQNVGRGKREKHNDQRNHEIDAEAQAEFLHHREPPRRSRMRAVAAHNSAAIAGCIAECPPLGTRRRFAPTNRRDTSNALIGGHTISILPCTRVIGLSPIRQRSSSSWFGRRKHW